VEAEYPASTPGDVHQRFTGHWNIEAPLLACAACGLRQVVTDPSASGTKRLCQLKALRYTKEQKADLGRLPEAYRPAVSHYEHGQDVYHVHQDLIHFPNGPDDPHVEICLSCWKAIESTKKIQTTTKVLTSFQGEAHPISR
jgi:hypothetical protein